MKKLRSAPVWDIRQKDYIGACDMRTLLGTLVFDKADCKAMLIADKPSEHRGSTDFKELVASKEAGPAGDIALNNAFRIIKPDAKLSEPLAVFGRGSCMIVGVQSPNQKHDSSIQLITQGRFLQFLFKIPRFRKFLDGFTNHSLAVASTTVISTPRTTSIKDAMRTMAKMYVSCLAVVDEDGKLIDNLSITDSYDLFNNQPEIETMDESVEVYIGRVRGSKFIEDLVFQTGTSIQHIVDTMLKKRILHAWIVNSDRQPIQCISATDIFKHVYIEYRKMARTKQLGLEDEDEDMISTSILALFGKLNVTLILRFSFLFWCLWRIRKWLRSTFP